MQVISIDKRVRSNTVQGLKEFNSQTLSTQAKKGEQLVCFIPAIRNSFYLMGDERVELPGENESMKYKMGSHDEK